MLAAFEKSADWGYGTLMDASAQNHLIGVIEH